MELKETFNPSYIGKRSDILDLIPIETKKVLDVGCSIGTLGEQIKQKTGAEIVGIEIDDQMAEIARGRLDSVLLGNIEETNLVDRFGTGYFDCIIFADILEHLRDPWTVLSNSTKWLKNEGIVVASIPNIRHYTTIINLLVRGYWPYANRGIHDRTHLRFFAWRNIQELFDSANLEIIRVSRNYRIFERPHPINKFTRFIALPPLKNFLTFQYLMVAKNSV